MDPSSSTVLAPTPQLRSERMLREMLDRDGLARSRSQSRGPNSSNASSSGGTTSTAAPGTTPRKPKSLAGMTPSGAPSLSRNRSAGALSMGSSLLDMDDVPIFAAGGFGAPSAGVVVRPHLPSPRKTHDGIISIDRASSPVPALPSRHATAPTTPAPLVHTHSSPLFTSSHRHQKQASRDGSFDDCSSPSTSSSSPSHNPSTPSSFNLHLASEFCRQQQGYVSFAEIEGLGRPAGEDEDERKERERLEAEYRRKKAWFGLGGWLEDGILGQKPAAGAHHVGDDD